MCCEVCFYCFIGKNESLKFVSKENSFNFYHQDFSLIICFFVLLMSSKIVMSNQFVNEFLTFLLFMFFFVSTFVVELLLNCSNILNFEF